MSLISRGRPSPASDSEGGDISIHPDDRPSVARALAALLEGNSRAFCDILYLGLGDRWVDLRQTLANAQCIAILDPEAAEGIEIRDRGRTLAARLSDYR